MRNAYVLMTAMPPTKGHLHLIQFAASLGKNAHVIVCTQPGEPYWEERLLAISAAVKPLNNVIVHHIHQELPQEPEGHEGFWSMWTNFLSMFGFLTGDYIVASEGYGKTLAEEAGGIFMPYDIDRDIYYSKATQVRKDAFNNFECILPEFQPYVRKTVTFFGAESVGKTTVSRECFKALDNRHWLPEWARPYLERVGPEITWDKMERIWYGQKALQESGQLLLDKPLVIQDTDLLSTVGYWELWNERAPAGLILDAMEHKSHLYIVMSSNIPFVADPLRYGGDKRESDDDYWIQILDDYNLNYRVVDSPNRLDRWFQAEDYINTYFDETVNLGYTRVGKEYESADAERVGDGTTKSSTSTAL